MVDEKTVESLANIKQEYSFERLIIKPPRLEFIDCEVKDYKKENAFAKATRITLDRMNGLTTEESNKIYEDELHNKNIKESVLVQLENTTYTKNKLFPDIWRCKKKYTTNSKVLPDYFHILLHGFRVTEGLRNGI